MKKIFAAMFAMLFAASTGVYAAKHMPGEKADEKKADAKAAPAKAEAKKDDKAKK